MFKTGRFQMEYSISNHCDIGATALYTALPIFCCCFWIKRKSSEGCRVVGTWGPREPSPPLPQFFQSRSKPFSKNGLAPPPDFRFSYGPNYQRGVKRGSHILLIIFFDNKSDPRLAKNFALSRNFPTCSWSEIKDTQWVELNLKE